MDRVLFEPVITEVVVCEFIEHCRKGLKGVVYTEEDIDLFFNCIEPVLDFENIKRNPVIEQYSQFVGIMIHNILYENGTD